MYRIPRYRVQLVREGSIQVDDRHYSTPEAAAEAFQAYLGDVDREHFLVMLLDTKNKIIGINTVAIGSLNATLVHPREVYKPAVSVNAASVILAHNHPSGDTSPSEDDITMTRRLVEAGGIMGIPVLDHVVLGERGHYTSMRQESDVTF